MFNKFGFFLIVIFIFSLFTVYSNSLSCEYRLGACQPGETALIHTSGVLSAHAKSPLMAQSPYQYSVCCSSPYTNLDFNFVSTSNSCGPGAQDLLYFTSNTNARVAIDYTPSHHSNKLCYTVPYQFSNLALEVDNTDRFERAGYSCLFRVSDPENGHISSCAATYDGGKQYEYVVWGRLVENLNTMVCNSDCTSRLDGRVYTACSNTIGACSAVPSECNGSLLGGWVAMNDDSGREIQCSPNWSNTRDQVFTQADLEVSSSSSNCSDIISTKRTVIIDNEPVVMHIYICSN